MINTPKKTLPRIALDAHGFYMGMLFMASAKCRDPGEQRGALIVDRCEQQLVFGFNGAPSNEWGSADWSESQKSKWLVIAEEQAIDRALLIGVDLGTATLYVTGPPLLRVVRRCAARGLKKIIYGQQIPEDFDESEWRETLSLAKDFFVQLNSFGGNLNWLRDRIIRLERFF